MPDALVYFATNRAQTGVAPNGNRLFGADVMPFTKDSPVYSAVPVTNINFDDANSGAIGAMRPFTGGQFSDAITTELQAANCFSAGVVCEFRRRRGRHDHDRLLLALRPLCDLAAASAAHVRLPPRPDGRGGVRRTSHPLSQ